MENSQGRDPRTAAVAAGRPEFLAGNGVNLPIDLNATFHAGGINTYGRYENSTWQGLESAIGALEGGETLIYSSGMAAISAVFALLPVGSVVVASNQGYSGTMSLLKSLVAQERIEVRWVSVSKTADVLAALPGSALLWLESPTNPMLEVAEVKTLIAAAKAANVGVGMDNTFATPINQRPLELGADIAMNSVTKYLSGHSDILMGSLSTNDLALKARLEEQRRLGGAIPGPFETWLALRGLRTFPIRMERAQLNAKELLPLLTAHPKVSKVHHPGFGAIISFEISGDAAAAERVCAKSTLIIPATSLGGVESLWERRRRWPSESESVPENLIRLSVGCEAVSDIWLDIQNSLAAI